MCEPAEWGPLTAAVATADAERSPCMGLALANAAVALLDCEHTSLANTTEASAAKSMYEVFIPAIGLNKDRRPLWRWASRASAGAIARQLLGSDKSRVARDTIERGRRASSRAAFVDPMGRLLRANNYLNEYSFVD